VVDITARKSLEDQLLHAQKMESIGRLAGGIAHDFNNMLFAIRGYAELLQEDLDAFPGQSLDVQEIRRSVAAIGTAADKASTLTAQLLAFGRRQVVHPVAMNMRSAVSDLEMMLRRLIGEQVRLVLDLDPSTGLVQADPGQLDQILVNLVVNARDAMPSGGTLTIQTSNVYFDEPYAVEHFEVQPGPYVMLAVQDTGMGMDRETRRHVFEPFFTTKEPGKGTGLGLATIYGIVKQAGGHIWLYSEPGRGSTFKVYFPQLETVVAVEQPRPDDGGRAHAGTILLVEDEPAVRALSRKVLERAGYLVIAPEDPRDAQSLIEGGKREIDVLVTDVVMPEVSGPELARRTLAARPRTAIVLLSGYSADDAEIADLVAQGATFASKPLGTRDLLQVIGDALVRAARVG
jgi:nitrogen-specific signal transduction histidine kinase/CheY-like chemotaxis protein